MSGQASASRARRPVPDTALGIAGPLAASIALPAKVATRRLPLYDAYQLGDALLRNSIPNSLGREPVPSCQKSWTHASRNAESLIKLARQDHHGRGDGRLDHQFRNLGYQRYLQG